MRRLRQAARARLASFACGAAFALACASELPPDPRYQPAESILEVVAVLHRHVPDDTYRFEPARDFTGRNVYRASLLRLENLERAHAEQLRAGSFDEVIAFAKGRALERIRGFDLAARSYRRAAQSGGSLKLEALRSAALCDALSEAVTIAPAPAETGAPTSREAALERFATRAALLGELATEARGTHYEAVLKQELERADEERARFLVSLRALYADGDVRALSALQQVVVDYRDSKNNNSHLLALADLYATLAEAYVEAYPPESIAFDPPRFEELVESAARIYESVSNQDGAPEKLEAARRLEAFLAFTLKVDRDRFSP